MTDHHGRPAGVPERVPGPGRPLWLAAEKARLEKFDAEDVVNFAPRIGIGRSTYNRLQWQRDRPATRTVKKIAATIGLPLADAMRLAGYSIEDPRQEQDPVAEWARPQIRALREIAEQTGATLGQVLVQYNLARPEELRLTADEVVGEIQSDTDLPDDLKKQFLDGYRRLRREVAETARRRQEP